jgi:TolB-like protein
MKPNFAVFIVCVAMLVACGPHMATTLRVEEKIPAGSGIAVLPLENLSGRENAAEKLTDYLVLSLLSQKDLVVTEFGKTYEQMRKHRVRSAAFLTDEQIDSLASGLGIRYLVAGAVLEFNELDNQYLGKIPQLSLNVRVIDCQSKRTIWSSAVNARGDQSEVVFGIGAVRSKDELAQKVAAQTAAQIGGLVGK